MNAHRASRNPIVLHFNEISLRKSDVELLGGPYWVNDQLISFYYGYLESIKYKNNPNLLFMSPVVTQFLKFIKDYRELEELLKQVGAPKKPYIFFALNNNDTEDAGGTHWSLLVYSRPEKAFFHFDSLGDSNSEASDQFVRRIKKALKCENFEIKSIQCLQQTNLYDCGIHVICMTENIADNVTRKACVEGAEPLPQYLVRGKRYDMLKLIEELASQM